MSRFSSIIQGQLQGQFQSSFAVQGQIYVRREFSFSFTFQGQIQVQFLFLFKSRGSSKFGSSSIPQSRFGSSSVLKSRGRCRFFSGSDLQSMGRFHVHFQSSSKSRCKSSLFLRRSLFTFSSFGSLFIRKVDGHIQVQGRRHGAGPGRCSCSFSTSCIPCILLLLYSCRR